MRCSPLVRIRRSGSGMSGGEQVAREQVLVDRVGIELPGAHRLGDARARRATISARPP